MNETPKISLTQRKSSVDEVNRSTPNLYTKSGSVTTNISRHQISKETVDDPSQFISKSQQTIVPPFSDPEVNRQQSTITQPEQTCNEVPIKQLCQRESSLENLTEDDPIEQHNASASDNEVVCFLQKPDTTEDVNDFTKKPEPASKLRRTMYSLFSCCSTKSRRPALSTNMDCGAESKKEQTTELRSRNTTLNCLRLRKLFDFLDESDINMKRVASVRQSFPSIPYRDGDKTESTPSHKAGDNVQSENGSAKLSRPMLLGPVKTADQDKKCFIIDLDETLVHSSFKMVDKADFKVGVDIEGTVHTVYVLKRPHVDVFLQKMGRIFECVLFTASLAKYADPVTDFLDKWRVFRWRLFRESCVFHRGNYVKDLSMLGRSANQIAILDNSPASYMFHPDSAVQITSWFDDPKDTALLDLIPYLEQLSRAPSVPTFLAAVKPPPKATVPVSVMLPLPCNSAAMAPTPEELSTLPSSSHPIMSVQPSQPVAPSLPDVISPHRILASLPFSSSRNKHHLKSACSLSLPSLSRQPLSRSACLSSRSDTNLMNIATSQVPFLTQTFRITDTPTHRITDTHTQLITDTHTQLIIDTYTQRITDTHTQLITDTYTQRITDTQTQRITDTQTRPMARSKTYAGIIPALYHVTLLDKCHSSSTPAMTVTPHSAHTIISTYPPIDTSSQTRSISFSLCHSPRSHSPTRSRSFHGSQTVPGL